MGSYMFCENMTEALELEIKAKGEAAQLLNELQAYIEAPAGAIGIDVQRVLYPFSGWAIEADLTWDGEVVRHYDAFDMLALELTELELKILLKSRSPILTA